MQFAPVKAKISLQIYLVIFPAKVKVTLQMYLTIFQVNSYKLSSSFLQGFTFLAKKGGGRTVFGKNQILKVFLMLKTLPFFLEKN